MSIVSQKVLLYQALKEKYEFVKSCPEIDEQEQSDRALMVVLARDPEILDMAAHGLVDIN